MNTSNSKKLKFLAALSIALLLAVLVYWNTDNYNRATIELKQDLVDQMTLASSVYRDSIVQDLFRFIEFEQSLDSITVRDNFDFLTDSIHSRLSPLKGKSTSMEFTLRVDSRIGHDHTENLPMTNAQKYENAADTSLRIMYDEENDRKIIVWGSDVKKIPNTITVDPKPVKGVDWMTGVAMDTIMVFDSNEGNDFKGEMPRLYTKIDSIFTDKLKQVGVDIPHTLVLFERSDDGELPAISIPLEYGNILDGGRPYAVFNNYKKYLLNKIVPSLLMSCILLLVIGMSFFTILKSWLAQDRLTQVKNEFVSNMTHELKTPISTIGVALEALENFGGIEDPIRRKEYLDISKHEINRLRILVDKVLKMSTLDVQEELVLTSEVDLRMLMDDMLKSMKLHLDKNNAQLKYNVQGDDFSVRGDKVHLTNVLYNLLDNAIKYSTKEPIIDIEVVSGVSNVQIIIKDEGIGVPKGYESKVFERFFRVPTKDRHNVKGHGLGLHYVKTIIDKHRGSVSLKNRLNVGSKLTVTIPKAHG